MMGPAIAHIGPISRVTIAIAPFLAAVLLRVFVGRSRLMGSLITLATGWFALNVLLSPSFEKTRETLYALPERLFH